MKRKIVLLVFLILTSVTCFSCIGLVEYEEKYKEEDDKIFGTYNKDYKKNANKDSKLIILEVGSTDAKRANVAIVNYISNVGGEFVSADELQSSKSTIYGLKIGVGFVGGLRDDSNRQYTILAPVDAKFADNLQERLDKYLYYNSCFKQNNHTKTKGGG